MSIRDTAVTDFGEALVLLRRTAAQQGNVLGADHPNVLRTLVSCGGALASIGGPDNIAEARGIFVRCEALQSDCLDAKHPDVVKTRQLMAEHS